jgi:hypothetical protein
MAGLSAFYQPMDGLPAFYQPFTSLWLAGWLNIDKKQRVAN